MTVVGITTAGGTAKRGGVEERGGMRMLAGGGGAVGVWAEAPRMQTKPRMLADRRRSSGMAMSLCGEL
jgi:hypothetical protein